MHMLCWGWRVLTFMSTCVTCTCYITSLGCGVSTFMVTCVTCTCYHHWVGGVSTVMVTCVTCTC